MRPSEIFLRNFLGSVLTLGTLYYLEFLLAYGVSKSSHLILFFMVWGTSTLSSVVALTKFHPQPQWRWVHFCPHLLHNLLSVELLTITILTGVRWYRVILFSISWTLSDVDNFSWDLFRMAWLKLTCWNWFLRSAQVGLPFRWPALGHFVRGGVSYRLPCRPCEHGVPVHTPLQVVLWQKARRRPLVFRPHADFFFLL